MTDDSSHASSQARIESLLARVQHETQVPGIALAIRIGGRRVLAAVGTQRAGGGAALTSASRFHLGCVTKLLTAAVAHELDLRGALDLGASLREYLPELAGSVHGEEVKMRHLLAHTSGFRGTGVTIGGTRSLSWEGLVAYLRGAPQHFAPGAVFSYEHTEAVLLGRILERAAGRPLMRLVRETIFAPLGIAPGRLAEAGRDKAFAGRHDFDLETGRFRALGRSPRLLPPWHAAFSNYTLCVDDLLKVAEALLGSEQGAAKAVAPATRAALGAPVVRLPTLMSAGIADRTPGAFGSGAAIFPGSVTGRDAVTIGQCIGLCVDAAGGIAIAIGLNARAPRIRDRVVGALLGGLGPAGPAPRWPFLDGVEAPALAGDYVGPGGARVCVAAAGTRLILEHGREGRRPAFVAALVPERGRVRVQSPIPDLKLGFFRAPGGAVGLMLGLEAYRRIARS